jgi:hypothetical protein
MSCNSSSSSSRATAEYTAFTAYHAPNVGIGDEDEATATAAKVRAAVEEEYHRAVHSCWARVTAGTQHPVGSVLILLTVCGVVALVGQHAFHPTLSAGMDAYLPRSSSSIRALQTLERDFSPGATYPYSLVVGTGDGRYGASALSDLFVAQVTDMVSQFIAPGSGVFPNNTVVLSYMYAMDLAVPSAFLNASEAGTLPPPYGPLLKDLLRQFLSIPLVDIKRTIQLVQVKNPWTRLLSFWAVDFQANVPPVYAQGGKFYRYHSDAQRVYALLGTSQSQCDLWLSINCKHRDL